MAQGVVYLVGAGPGDPGLLTVKGLECIRTADVLVYDRLASPALVARARPDAEKVYVGKAPGCHGRKQADISRLLVERALAGKTVCRLKGGDPFVFGRGGEEADLLAEHGVRFEVVPGITAGVAAPAYAGIPVTHRDHAGSVALVTGHPAPDGERVGWDWQGLAGVETLLIYMGVETLPEVAARLIAAGRGAETPAAVISQGTLAEQQVVTGTLADIAGRVRAAGVQSPAMIVVGSVVTLRDRLRWFEGGRRVLVPLAPGLAGDGGTLQAVERLRTLGAEVWEWPVAAVEAPADWGSLDGAVRGLGRYGALLFTSPGAVRPFLARLLRHGLDSRALAGARLGAATTETAAALAEAGLLPDFVGEAAPSAARTLVLGEPGEATAVAERIRNEGGVADGAVTHSIVPRYDTAPLLREALSTGLVHDLLCTSAEAVQPLLGLLGPDGIALLEAVRLICIEPGAAAILREAGLVPEMALLGAAA
jgi:uroporphyrinogen III methyltransferase / synthase